MPRTSALTATGPLPGRIGPAVISRVKVSPGFGLPVTPARRPENQTVTRNGPPCSPGSSQNVGVRTSCSMPSAHAEIRPAAAEGPAARGTRISAPAVPGPRTSRAGPGVPGFGRRALLFLVPATCVSSSAGRPPVTSQPPRAPPPEPAIMHVT